MNDKTYNLTIYAMEEELSEINTDLEKKLKEKNLERRVFVYPVPIHYIDHGINPVGDSDLRAYFRITSNLGKELLQTSDVILKFIMRDKGSWIERAVEAIKSNERSYNFFYTGDEDKSLIRLANKLEENGYDVQFTPTSDGPALWINEYEITGSSYIKKALEDEIKRLIP